MKCTSLGYNPNLGEEFMRRLQVHILGEEFVQRLEAIMANRSRVPLPLSSSSTAAKSTYQDAKASILKVKKLMYKTIHYEEQGRLLSIDHSLPHEVQVKLRIKISKQAQQHRLRVFKRLAEAQAVQYARDGLSEICPQNVQISSVRDTGNADWRLQNLSGNTRRL